MSNHNFDVLQRVRIGELNPNSQTAISAIKELAKTEPDRLWQEMQVMPVNLIEHYAPLVAPLKRGRMNTRSALLDLFAEKGVELAPKEIEARVSKLERRVKPFGPKADPQREKQAMAVSALLGFGGAGMGAVGVAASIFGVSPDAPKVGDARSQYDGKVPKGQEEGIEDHLNPFLMSLTPPRPRH